MIDTSVLFPHPRGPPYKSALRVLASRHLLRTIQQGEHAGRRDGQMCNAGERACDAAGAAHALGTPRAAAL